MDACEMIDEIQPANFSESSAEARPVDRSELVKALVGSAGSVSKTTRSPRSTSTRS
jgi:hypothetical protein